MKLQKHGSKLVRLLQLVPGVPVSATPSVRLVLVSSEQGGQRVDNFLLRELKGVPKSRIYRMLREGEVRVNGGRAKPSRRLDAGDSVRIPPVRTAAVKPISPSSELIERVERSVLFEDERVLILSKESGMAVHGGSGLAVGLIEVLRRARPHSPMLELAHRLDRDASGCLVIAKSRETLLALHGLFRTGGVEKRYLALLKGRWSGGPREIRIPLAIARRRGGRRSVADEQGREAISRFSALKRYASSSLMEVRIHTGRLHQIRAHASALGMPIAGDDKYGDFAFNRSMRALGLRRLFLHASAVSFQLADRRYRAEAGLDESLASVLARLETPGPRIV